MRLFVLISLIVVSLPATAWQATTEDLSRYNFNGGERAKLSGEWDFYWQQLLTPADFLSDTMPPPDKITVPKPWNKHPLAGRNGYNMLGFATYRKRLILPPHQQNLTILVPVVSCAARFWVNGQPAGEIGRVSSTPENYKGKIASASLNVPAGVQQVDLVVQVSNFTSYTAGITEDVIIGEASAVARMQNVKRGIENVFAGSLIAMFIQQLIFFLLYRRGTASFYLAMICLAVAIRAFISNSSSFLLPDLLPFLSFEAWRKVEFLVTYSTVATFPLYISSLFTAQASHIYTRGMVVLATLLWVLTLATPLYIYGSVLDVAHAALLSSFVYSFFIIRKAWKEGNPEARIIFFGLAASFPFIFMEILKQSFLHAAVPFDLYMAELGVLVFLLFQEYLLANHHSKSYRQLEAHSQDLKLAVNERTAELSKSNEIKNTLLAIISHDLRSPLHALKSVLNVYNVGVLNNQEMNPFLENVEDELARTNIMVDNILLWANNQISGPGIDIEQVDISAACAEHQELFSAMASRKKIVLTNHVPPGVTATADKSIVNVVLRNLISNAIKFTHEGGRIDIRMPSKANQSEGKTVVLVVEDTGIGMGNEQTSQLFTTTLLKSSRGTENEKGAGIGLGLSSDYLKKINGRLWVESTLGVGSRFYMELPGAT